MPWTWLLTQRSGDHGQPRYEHWLLWHWLVVRTGGTA